MTLSRTLLILPLAALATCARQVPPPTPLVGGGGSSAIAVTPLPLDTGVAAPRVNGDVGAPNALTRSEVAIGTGGGLYPGRPRATGANLSGGDVSLDFSDTDVRDVVAQVLGSILQVTYSIDPAVRGTATFHSARPVPRGQLIPILQTLLAQNNATLVQSGSVFRVAPTAAAGVPSFAAGDANAGGAVIPLRFAAAEDLVKILQPVVGSGGKLTADPGRNAIIVTGEPQGRDALASLVRSFDTDLLAGQSYALLPAPQGDAKDLASTLQEAFRSQSGGALAGLVRVLPLQRVNALLVVASNPRYLAEARRVYGLIERNQKLTQRSWHVYYLENSRANDIAYVLQKAFTPNDVSAQPEATNANQGNSNTGTASLGSGGASSSSGSGSGGLNMSGGGISGITGGSGLGGQSSAGGGSSPAPGGSPTLTLGGTGAPSPLIGSLDSGGGNGGGGQADDNAMRIIPNPQNNALVVYATAQEEDTVEAMLRKIDLLPLEVRIDATIAEVTLNDQLQFGTQFFFKEGSVNQTLSNATSGFASGLPGFVFGATAKGVQATLSALQAVTTVHVLSSPELMVLDNQAATLQVGSLVPYLTQSSQSTLVSGSPIINSVDYRPTGVLMQVTPRVNSGGLVTLDIAQEVSSVDTSASTTIGSPTFSDRSVRSRVVVQDGETLGLAGLISDSVSTGNSGIPFLKDVPVLNLLLGTQNNKRTRTELLVLITPHVVHDQRDALALTQDLKDQLVNAAAVPAESQALELSGSTDPSARLRRRLHLQK